MKEKDRESKLNVRYCNTNRYVCIKKNGEIGGERKPS